MKRLAVLAILAVLAAAAAAWWTWTRLTTPHRGFAESEVFVSFPPGTSVARIGDELARAGVVSDALTLRIAARLSGSDRRLQAGEYRFSDAATAFDVVARLARGDVYTLQVTFPEGLTAEEMAGIFERNGLGPAADFERAAADRSAMAGLDPTAATLEGYLFPDTYALPRVTRAPDVVAAMVARFTHVFDAEMRREAAERGMSPHDVVTLASLIEKETGAVAERPLVSAVYHNRLKLGMPLQCDPTVIYALRRLGRWRGNLTRDDLQVNSPYNTYRHAGLPPGPIASPGRTSLEAALRPADVKHLYFVSRNDGTHVFASTLAEHTRNVQEWQVRYFRNRN
jgi:UPF0755 protein